MPVVEDSDQVLPLLSIGDTVETDDGPGTLVSVQFQTAQYNGSWELEPPSLVVELDSGETVHTCLCSITLPGTKLGTKLLHREFERLWPPKTSGVPEDSKMLIPEGDEDPPDAAEPNIREGHEKEATMRNTRRYAEEESGYQGWKNYETWNAALWINNDQSMYEYLQEEITQLREDEEEPGDVVHELAGTMKNQMENMYDDYAADLPGPLADLLTAAMGEIDWREIAQSFLED